MRFSSQQVQITLMDKNDSPPQFSSDLFEVAMPEDSEQGDVVTSVVAMDADETGSVTYSIREGSEKKFDIDPMRGRLYLIS
jgi:protocadherin Fat 4